MNGSASQAGFYYQNNVAALYILDCLFFKTDIESIYLENYEKGEHIDDIIIYKKQSAEYFQVKWTADESNTYTLYSLLSHEEDGKSIFKQLAEGYNTAKKYLSEFNITLFATRKFSNQKRPTEQIYFGLAEFVGFLSDIQSHNIQLEDLKSNADYKTTLNLIMQETNLSDSDFEDLLHRIQFKLGQPNRDELVSMVKRKMVKLGLEENLYEILLDRIVNWSINGDKITKDGLLNALGIDDRLNEKIPQTFKVIDDRYFLLDKTLKQSIDKAIDDLSGGYILVEGSAGIGKSTFLNMYGKQNHNICFTYYCFIPDENDFQLIRHKESSFLQSMCIAIERRFDGVIEKSYSSDYAEKLSRYLFSISELSGKINQKVIFVVDGLDHVAKNTTSSTSTLLDSLKGNLPTNIFFIISSQYFNFLSPEIRSTVNLDPRRTIKMSPFSEAEAAEYCLKKGLNPEEIIKDIMQISGGLPLYLHYITEKLLTVHPNAYKSILSEFPTNTDNKLTSYHEAMYLEFEKDILALWVMALLAFRKEYTSVAVIILLLQFAGITCDEISIEEILLKYRHLLRERDAKCFALEHNSFREHILLKDGDKRERLSKALLQYYESNATSDESYRNYFRYLYRLDKHLDILDKVNVDWLKLSWNSFRPLSEIESNLRLAWMAAAKMGVLSEFVRIGFLVAQLNRLSEVLNESKLNIPSLLLHGGLVKESKRIVWDGDAVRIQKKSFIDYAFTFNELQLEPLPKEIIDQGFSQYDRDQSMKMFEELQKFRAVYCENIEDTITRLYETSWHTDDKFSISSLHVEHSQSQNEKINKRIVRNIIDKLYELKKSSLLSQAIPSMKDEADDAKAHLALLLMSANKDKALNILRDVNINLLSQRRRIRFLYDLSHFLNNSEISQLFPTPSIDPIEVKLELIVESRDSERDETYCLSEEVLTFFETLAVHLVYDDHYLTNLHFKISTFPDPVKSIYEGLFTLAALFHKTRNEDLTQHQLLELLQKVLMLLNIPKHIVDSRSSERSLQFEKTYIARDIHNVYSQIFTLATKVLDLGSLCDLTDFFLDISKTEDGYIHYKNYLAISKALKSSEYQVPSSYLSKLIKLSEDEIRKDSDTTSLLESASELAQIYGSCGLKEDFIRIYNELIDIAFGLYYKKDYQSEKIIYPLTLLHTVDPEGSFNRMLRVLEAQVKLKNVGRNRMHSIALSEIIAFSAKHYPSFAFTILDKEEYNIHRPYVIYKIVNSLLKNVNDSSEMELIWSVIQTLPRWDHNEDEYRNSCNIFLRRAIELKLDELVILVIDALKYNILDEVDQPALFKNTNKMLSDSNISNETFGIPFVPEKDENYTWDNNNSKVFLGLPACSELSRLSLDVLDETLETLYSRWIIDIRYDTITDCFRNFYAAFQEFYETLAEEFKEQVLKEKKHIFEQFFVFRERLCSISQTSILTTNQLIAELDSFVFSVNQLFSNLSFDSFVDRRFDKLKWAHEKIVRMNNPLRSSLLHKFYTEDEALAMVENITNPNSRRSFINKWLTGEIKTICMLSLIEHLFTFGDIDSVKQILGENSINFYFEFGDRVNNRLKTRCEDILKKLCAEDSLFVRRLILNAFIESSRGYDYWIVTGCHQLSDMSHLFNDPQFPFIYFESNLQYNSELSKGLITDCIEYDPKTLLSDKPFEEIIISYLVSIFNYPVVKTRENAISSLLFLIKSNPHYLTIFLKYGIELANDNQIEHSLVVLQSLALVNSLPPFSEAEKKLLLSLLNKGHFNINETVKDLCLLINQKSSFLTIEEQNTVTSINRQSSIILPNRFLSLKKARKFIYSNWLFSLLDTLLSQDSDEFNFANQLYTDMVTKHNYSDYTGDNESTVHKHYNINSNFDTLEISSPYSDVMRSSINTIFYEKIRKGSYSPDFIDNAKFLLRLYNPCSFVSRKSKIPQYIEWINDDATDLDFLHFTDIDDLKFRFIQRDSDYVTLCEVGDQRRKEDYANHKMQTCYFRISAFLYPKEKGMPIDKDILDNCFITENLYHTEIPDMFPSSKSHPSVQLIPLLGISDSYFRGQDGISIPMLLPDFMDDCEYFGLSAFDLLSMDSKSNLKLLEWQSPYTQAGRRRYKPIAKGTTLSIEKTILKKILEKTKCNLLYSVSLRRSIDKYMPEDEMQWYSKSFIWLFNESELE